MTIASALLIAIGLSTGLWLTHSEPTVTLVAGTPVAVSVDGGEAVRDPRFIAKVLHDVNGNPPYPPNSVTSCPALGFREDALRFDYSNGDHLTIQIRSGCGVIAVAGYAPDMMARGGQGLIDDLDNWPIASP
jgi:hypothetical protein